ncbi:MAG: hypothetical protein U1C96_09785 [Gallionella sp.]|nr:hypothetical protein [Gallionella sp.]
MSAVDKTVKLRAYAEDANNPAAQGKQTDDKSLDLAMKDAQIEEERSRSLEHLKTIVQLRESLKQEQAKVAEITGKAAEMENKMRSLGALENGELAKKNAELEQERRLSLEQLKMIEQLRESLKQEQAKAAAANERSIGLEAKIRELTDSLGKIAEIAGAAKGG